MSLWVLIFLYPIAAGNETEGKLAKLVIDHGGDFDVDSSTTGRLREVCGYFATEQAAEKCGKAAHDLHIQYLSWSVEEVEVTA